MNRIEALFRKKSRNILNLYFTAGYPEADRTSGIIRAMAAAGVDMVEIGIPYSDPLADGPTIQASSAQALAQGMSLAGLFESLADIRDAVEIPLLMMGYYNQVLQYGPAAFCRKAADVGIDGLILPDLPPEVFEAELGPLAREHGLRMTFLITPQSSPARIRMIDRLSDGFVYMVSDSSITGAAGEISAAQIAYFERIQAMELESPRLIGFGISDRKSFETACGYANGAIIGSAFIRHLAREGADAAAVEAFVSSILSTDTQPTP